MQIKLFQRDENYLHPREIVALLAQAMPTIKVDWVKGNEIVEEMRKELVSADAPEVIIASHQSLVDQTAYIQIWFPQFPNSFVYFIAQPYSALVFHCSDPNNDSLLELSSAQAAKVLGYQALPTGDA